MALKQVKVARIGYILISVLFYILGVVCIIAPGIDRKTSVMAVGIILIVYGIIKITGYLSKEIYSLAFQHDLACGLFLIVLGIVVMAVGTEYEEHLLQGMGLLVLLDSLLCIQTSIDAKRFGIHAWYVILVSAILSGILGVVLSVTSNQTIAGCSLLAEGFLRQYIVQCTVSLAPPRTLFDEKADSRNAFPSVQEKGE